MCVSLALFVRVSVDVSECAGGWMRAIVSASTKQCSCVQSVAGSIRGTAGRAVASQHQTSKFDPDLGC